MFKTTAITTEGTMRKKIGHPPLDVAQRQAAMTDSALWHLREALKCAKIAEHPRTAARIRAAVSSAKGAVRISDYRVGRAHHAQR